MIEAINIITCRVLINPRILEKPGKSLTYKENSYLIINQLLGIINLPLKNLSSLLTAVMIYCQNMRQSVLIDDVCALIS